METLVQGLGLFVAVTGAGAACWKGGRVAWRGVLRVRAALESVDRIVKEVTPNGGGSIKDMVSAQHRGLQRVSGQLAAVSAGLEALSAKVSIGHDAYGVGTFAASAAGLWTQASPAHCRAVGCSEDELLGFNWLSWVEPASREAVRGEWAQCVHDRRAFDMDIIFTSSAGVPVVSRVLARPSLDEHGGVSVWQGFISYKRRSNDPGREGYGHE